jgi:hypothetical protein
VLDAEQVRRIVAGEALEAHKLLQQPPSVEDSRRQAKDRAGVMQSIPPLKNPLTRIRRIW